MQAGGRIEFNISDHQPVGGGGKPAQVVIQVLSPLPYLRSSSVTVDGWSQPVDSLASDRDAGMPRVAIDGAKIPPGVAEADGIVVGGAQCVIQGLDVRSFPRVGVFVAAAGCSLGGVWANHNGVDGIYLDNSATGTAVGDTASELGRVVASGNGEYGVLVYAPSCSISNVYAGTDATGAKAVPNTRYGIAVGTSATGTAVGDGSTALGRVVASGNGETAFLSMHHSCRISNVYAGTDATGATAVPNTLDGIVIDTSATGTAVGDSSTALGRVVASGNGQNGVIVHAHSCSISNVYAGTDATGAKAVPNTLDGIQVDTSATGTAVGDSSTALGRVVASGNGDSGVLVLGPNCSISNVYAGTDATGAKAVPNTLDGIRSRHVRYWHGSWRRQHRTRSGCRVGQPPKWR